MMHLLKGRQCLIFNDDEVEKNMISFTDVIRDEEIEDKKFDILIAALGYERRCVYIPQKLKQNYNNGLCLQFHDRQELSFKQNLDFYETSKFHIEHWFNGLNRDNVIKFILNNMSGVEHAKNLKIAIDISSMNRQMVAEIIYLISNKLELDCIVEISILYVSAAYIEPSEEMLIMKKAGPVIPEYAGWYINPSDPLYAVVGLGYENGKAIGALEYLDAAAAWLFKPVGENSAYLAKVEEVNHDLISMVGKKRTISYKLFDPYDTFIKIRSLIEGLKEKGRIVLIPFGPKLFNAICIVLAEIYHEQIAVWRISAEDEESPVDYQAAGNIISFTFRVESQTNI